MIGVPQKVTHASVRLPVDLGEGVWAFQFQPYDRLSENLYLAFDRGLCFLVWLV